MDTLQTTSLGSALVFSVLAGTIIGVERQMSRNSRKHLGMRDFGLVALMGFLASVLSPVYPFIFPMAFLGVMLFAIVVFWFESLHRKEEGKYAGVTTILTFVITFLIASLSVLHLEFWFLATIMVLVLMMLEQKQELHTFVTTIDRGEVFDFSLLLAIVLIITPLIPDGSGITIPLYSTEMHAWTTGKIPFQTLWKVSYFVSLMSFGAHFITKYIRGKYSLPIAAFFGGLVSSLATVALIMKQSKTQKISHDSIVLAYLASATGSILKDFVIAFGVFGAVFMEKITLPFIAILCLMMTMTIMAFRKSKEGKESIKITDRPIPLYFIAKFVMIILVLTIINQVLNSLFTESWIKVINLFLSGFVSSAGALAATHGVNLDDTYLGVAVLLILLGSILAKFCYIIKHMPFKTWHLFGLPIVYMIIVGAITFSITFL
ncbi:MAG: DUF4010 domain-containing protein [Candidatus Peregrinibacteria bacterium]